MKNFVQPGDVITLTAPADVKSGGVVVVGGFVGIAATDALQNAEVETALVGVFELPKSAGAIAAGQKCFWDGTAVATSGTTLLGAAVAAAGASAPTCRDRKSVV